MTQDDTPTLERDVRVGFVGGGNMAASLVGGLVANGHPPEAIAVTDIDAGTRDSVRTRFGVSVGEDNVALAKRSDAVVLAVKPQVMPGVLAGLAAASGADTPLFISVAAGVRLDALRAGLGGTARAVRCMPNTPALVRAGITALYADDDVDAGGRAVAEAILATAGQTLWVGAEGDLDAVTAISGSGPAYFFRLIELLDTAARELGLPADAARALSTQTALGAAKLAAASEEPAGVLRERVTSPGGTTAAALAAFEAGGLEALVHAAVRAARDRSRELGAASES